MKNILLSAGLSASMVLSGCATYDPYTGDQKTSNATKGAAIGASVAAIAAYLESRKDDSRVRNERILKAAGGGALIGGGVGYYMDRQEAMLRERLSNSGVSVVRDGDNINLIMPGNITFATNQSTINTNFYDVLDSVAIVINEFDKTIVAVHGHTDSTGSKSYNQLLSEQRANAVANYLMDKQVLRDRVQSVGFGETQPIASNDTPQGREQNRRVEITLLPITN